MRCLSLIVCVTLFGVSSSDLLAVQAVGRPQGASGAPIAQRATVGTDSLLIALRAQTETLRATQDSLVSMVQWSLGTVVGLALVLVGFNWFSNNRSYERDRQALKQELHGWLREELAREMEVQRGRLAELGSDLDRKADAIRGETDARVKEGTAQLLQPLWSEVRAALAGIRTLEITAALSEFRRWESADVGDNATDAAVRVIQLALANKEDWRVPDFLAKILKLVNEGASQDGVSYALLTGLLDALPDRYAADVASIRGALQRIREERARETPARA